MPTTETIKALEKDLKGLSYPEIERALANVSDQTLLRLFDCRSIKIGDSAAGLLRKREGFPLIISAILENRITAKLGKIRAANILFVSGRHYPDALRAYLTLLKDRNDEVADTAAFALVLWGEKGVIPSIEERRMSAKSAQNAKRFELACEALEKSNPAIFSPYFTDDKGIWK